MHDTTCDPLAEFRHVNVEGTLRLAAQAAEAGVNRFVFISSIKVNGDATAQGEPYRADSEPRATDPYGISKYEAEQGLLALARETSMEVVIIRPVLVYGPGVRANFLKLMLWLKRGVPLPFASIENRRSFLAVENLADIVVTCLSHPSAANEVFLVSDGVDLSTPDLFRRLGSCMGKPARLFKVPPTVLRTMLQSVGRGAEGQRLCGSLQVDISKTRGVLGWAPPVRVDDAIERTVKHFLRNAPRN